MENNPLATESIQSLRSRLIAMQHDPNRDENERQQIIKELEARFAYYSFRAECPADVIRFFNHALDYAFENELQLGALFVKTDEGGFPDTVAEFRSTIDLETLQGLVKREQDTHVLLETLRPVPLKENSLVRDNSIE